MARPGLLLECITFIGDPSVSLRPCVFLVLIGIAFAPLAGCSRPPITAEQIAAETNRRHTFPLDLGDGFRLDAVTAEGQAIVSTITLMDPTLGADPTLVEVMRAAAKSDICREIAAVRQAYTDAGLSLATRYKDARGNEIVRVDVQPAECGQDEAGAGEG